MGATLKAKNLLPEGQIITVKNGTPPPPPSPMIKEESI